LIEGGASLGLSGSGAFVARQLTKKDLERSVERPETVVRAEASLIDVPKGTASVIASYRMTAIAKTSVARQGVLPCCSGAEYAIVPLKIPMLVWVAAAVFASDLLRPKSTITTRPAEEGKC
jgi:hypothetical protein